MNKTHNYNGFWMLLGLVAMLSAPMAYGYATLRPAQAVTQHADAAH